MHGPLPVRAGSHTPHTVPWPTDPGPILNETSSILTSPSALPAMTGSTLHTAPVSGAQISVIHGRSAVSVYAAVLISSAPWRELLWKSANWIVKLSGLFLPVLFDINVPPRYE